MKALVTGASGFIGAHVARAVAAAGIETRLMARAGSDLSRLVELEAEIVRGDLRDPGSLRRCLDGCDLLFHVAALYSLRWADRRAVMETNVEGTRAILTAALDARVKRVVYTSSVAAVGLREDGRPSTELDTASLRHLAGAYKRSKLLAEQVALELCGRGLDVVIVNPSTPVGAGDVKPTPSGAIIVDFLRGGMPAYVQTGLNFVSVADVAAGHLLALERGRTGQRYILGAENMTLAELFARLEEVSGVAAPRWELPHWLAIAACAVDEMVLAPALRRRDPAPLAGALMARRPMYFDASRAVTELGFTRSPVREALAEAVRWFRRNGYVPDTEGGHDANRTRRADPG